MFTYDCRIAGHKICGTLIEADVEGLRELIRLTEGLTARLSTSLGVSYQILSSSTRSN